VDSFLLQRAQASAQRQTLMEQLNNYCPLVQEQICDNIFTASDCHYEDLPYSLMVRDVVEYLSVLQDSLLTEILGFRQELEDTLRLIEEWQQSLDDFYWALYTAIAFSLVLALLCVYILMGVVLAWRNKLPIIFSCIRSVLILPLFILLVLLAWVFSMVFVIGSIALADLCIDAPDMKLFALLQTYQNTASPIVLNFVQYYVSGT
jgi:hypothetical protein